MRDIWLIFKKECRGFQKSDRWIFVMYGILVLAWSVLLSNNMSILSSPSGQTGYLWLVFFSVIVSGNFSNATFVAERMSGSLEILLCCGVSRAAILAGKVLFIILMSTGIGVVCYGVALGIAAFGGEDIVVLLRIMPAYQELILYICACFLNAACGAWLSVRISNPRILPFVNLFVLVVIVILHGVTAAFYPLTLWSLSVALVCAGGLLYLFAFRDFKSERVIQPLVY